MADDSKAKADTSEEEGKNSEGKAEGAGTQTDKTADAPKFTQADLDRVASKTREEERDKSKRTREKEEREQKEKQAKEQGEFQKLADGYAKELDELRPKAEEADRYKEAVKTIAEAELKALPDEVREIAPDASDPLAVLAWLPKGKKLAEKLGGQTKRGNGGDPPPAGTPGVYDRIRKEVKDAQPESGGAGWLAKRFGTPASNA